jgi:hypothetical protein
VIAMAATEVRVRTAPVSDRQPLISHRRASAKRCPRGGPVSGFDAVGALSVTVRLAMNDRIATVAMRRCINA